jgi:ElaB/YqjD/DUF883 family membrane-anchored ribosome-binding protein
VNAAANPLSSNGPLEGEVRNAIGGAEELLQQAERASGSKAAELRERAMAQLEALREKLSDANDAVIEQSRKAARATDEYVHEHPWQVIAGAAGVGVLIGLLIARR